VGEPFKGPWPPCCVTGWHTQVQRGTVGCVLFSNILYFIGVLPRTQPACHVLHTTGTIVAFLMLSMLRLDIQVHNDHPVPAPNFPVHFVWSPDFIRLLYNAGNEPIRNQNARDWNPLADCAILHTRVTKIAQARSSICNHIGTPTAELRLAECQTVK
jgi:hypothetical protein